MVRQRGKGKEEERPPVRCLDCEFFTPGFRRGLCEPINKAWNGEQLQAPLDPHPCSSFESRLESVATWKEHIEYIFNSMINGIFSDENP